MTDCYCGSGRPFADCCQPVLADPAAAATAEALMRARYSAFVTGAVDFIIQTNHPRTRDEIDENVVRRWSEDSDWLGLDVLDRQGGEAGDSQARIEFVVRYRYKGQRQDHHELSLFETLDGVWYFVDGEPPPVRQVKRDAEKVGRNDPCPCGSGRKYKKCCGQAA